MEIKIKLLTLGMRQSDVLRLLQAKGIVVEQSEVSKALSGAPQNRYQKLRTDIEEVLSEIEVRNSADSV